MKGYGIVIWAADTLQSYPSALSNIGVRRLVSWLEKSISDFLITAVFDPNDAMLRASLTAEVDSFLGPIRSARGLDNYQVVCNDSNNPPSSVANGDLILDVYVDPTVHTKRIHLNAVIARAGGIQYAINLMSMSGQSSL
jgi:phage tail sheath protein FI